MDFLNQLSAAKFVPVIRTNSRADAQTAVTWLSEAGVKTFEVTFSVPEADALIRDLAADPDLFVGAGTVLSKEQAQMAIDAGSKFVVSPGFVDEVVQVCLERNIPVLPGAGTATEVWSAHQRGASVVKLFPASQLGGPGALKAFKAVYPNVAMMPTGGVKLSDIEAYLSAGAIAVGLGSEIAPAGDIANGERAKVVEKAAQLVEMFASS